MIDLPNRDQIAAITDVAALQALLDDIDCAIIHIESQLEFPKNDEGWEERAIKALALHRYVARLVLKRLKTLRAPHPLEARPARAPAAVAVRPEAEIHPLTLEALAPPLADPDPRTLTTTDAVDDQIAVIAARIDAVSRDRAAEIRRPAVQRDEAFLCATDAAIRRLKAQRMALQTRRGEITRAAKLAVETARNTTREALFIDVCREIMDRDTYMSVWDRVDEIQRRQSALKVA